METLVPSFPAVRRPRRTLWALRIVASVHLVGVLAQPVLAGLFLTGDVDSIGVHGAVAGGLAFVGLGLMAAAAAFVLMRGRLWVLPVAVLIFLAVGLQMAMGYSRVLAVHIPLGVAVTTLSVVLGVWVWTPSAGRPRGGAR